MEMKVVPVCVALFVCLALSMASGQESWPPAPVPTGVAISVSLPRTGTLPLAQEAYAALGAVQPFVTAPSATDSGAFPLFDAASFSLPFALTIRTGAQASLRARDVYVFTFRDLLTGKTRQMRRALGQVISPSTTTQTVVTITNRDVRLKPGTYQVCMDIQNQSGSLCGINKGSCELYLRAPGESRRHILAMQMLGYTTYFRDYDFGGYFSNFQATIPPTYDPLAPKSRHDFLLHFVGQTQKWAELLNYTGMGLIAASNALVDLKDQRAKAFAEETVASLSDYFVSMQTDFGPFHVTSDPAHEKWPDLPKPREPWLFYDTDQDGCYLEVLGPAVLKFKGRTGYASRVQQWAAACANSLDWLRVAAWDPNPPQGCNLRRYNAAEATADVWMQNRHPWLERPQCTVYDGRVVAGFAWACAAYYAVYGNLPDRFLTPLIETGRAYSGDMDSKQSRNL